MQIPLEVVFEGMEPSEAVRARIRRESSRLERFHARITSCRVVIELPVPRVETERADEPDHGEAAGAGAVASR